jgi:hypothetical protein
MSPKDFSLNNIKDAGEIPEHWRVTNSNQGAIVSRSNRGKGDFHIR